MSNPVSYQGTPTVTGSYAPGVKVPVPADIASQYADAYKTTVYYPADGSQAWYQVFDTKYAYNPPAAYGAPPTVPNVPVDYNTPVSTPNTTGVGSNTATVVGAATAAAGVGLYVASSAYTPLSLATGTNLPPSSHSSPPSGSDVQNTPTSTQSTAESSSTRGSNVGNNNSTRLTLQQQAELDEFERTIDFTHTGSSLGAQASKYGDAALLIGAGGVALAIGSYLVGDKLTSINRDLLEDRKSLTPYDPDTGLPVVNDEKGDVEIEKPKKQVGIDIPVDKHISFTPPATPILRPTVPGVGGVNDYYHNYANKIQKSKRKWFI